MYIKLINQGLNFFKNNAGAKKHLFDTSWQFFGTITKMVVGLFVGVWIIKYLGPDKFGVLSYAQSIVGLFTAIATLGLDQIVVRELVNGKYSREDILGTSFTLKLCGALFVLALLSAGIYLTPNDLETKILVFILASANVFSSLQVIGLFFQSKVESRYNVMAGTAGFVLVTVLKVLLLITGAPLLWFAVVILLESVFHALGLLFYYKKLYDGIKTWRYNKSLAKALLSDSWPLIFSGISISIGMRIDQVMLKSYLDIESVGIYAAGVRLAEVFNFIPMIVASSLYPRIVKIDLDKEEYKLMDMIKYIFYLLVILAIGVNACSYLTVMTLYGAAYLDSYKVLNILIWTVPLSYLSIFTSKLLLKVNKSSVIFARQVWVAVINIALNVLLIPNWGILGSAFATLLSNLLILVAGYFSRETRWIFMLKWRSIFFLN